MSWSDHPDNSNSGLWLTLLVLLFIGFILFEIWDYPDRVREVTDYETIEDEGLDDTKELE